MSEVFCTECKHLSECQRRCDSPCNFQVRFFGLVLYGGVDPHDHNYNNDCAWFEAGGMVAKDRPLVEGSVKKCGVGKKPLCRRPAPPKPQRRNN